MQSRLISAVEAVTVFGLSIAAAALLLVGIVGAVQPAVDSTSTFAAAKRTPPSVDATRPAAAPGAIALSTVYRLPPIVIIGQRTDAADKVADATPPSKPANTTQP